MWVFSLRDDVTGFTQGVNAAGEAKVALSQSTDDAGFAKLLDSDGNPIRTTEAGAISVSLDALMFTEQVDGSSLNTNKWLTSVSTMAVVQAGGMITLNSAGSVATGAYAILQTIRSFPMYGWLPLHIAFNAKSTFQPQANQTIEIGIGVASGTSAPTDGAYFRWTSSADFRCIINNGGETQSIALTAPVSNSIELLELVLVEDLVQFLINDEVVAEVSVPVGLAYPTSAGRLPLFARCYNGGTSPSQAPQLSIGQVTVTQQGMEQNKRWDQILASVGNGAYQSPTAFTQTANNTNSTAPVAATLSNTAAGYTTKGGKFSFAAVSGAETDYALFAFQVPANYQLYINAVNISCAATGAAIGATGTIFEWALGLNGSAVSLATADSPPISWTPRRVALGMQSFAGLAAIGTLAAPVGVSFETPLVVDGGRYLHVILRIPVGLNTGSSVFRGLIGINGYFE